MGHYQWIFGFKLSSFIKYWHDSKTWNEKLEMAPLATETTKQLLSKLTYKIVSMLNLINNFIFLLLVIRR